VPNTLLTTLGPDVNPFPVEMSASAPDLSGAFGAAEGVAALARLRVDQVAVTAAEAAATLADAQAALATVQSEADAAARTASDSRDQADAARRAAVAAATDSLVASRNGMHPTTALAVHGEVAPDELWAYGFRRALALPVGERVVETRSSAARAGRDERAADDALGEARALVESRTAEHDAAQAELTQAQTELAAADAAVVAAKDAAFSAFTGGTATPENLRVSVLDIPTRTLDAYLLAERRMAVEAPACRMRWWVVAGIGAVESGHGTYRGAYPGADGNVVPRIIGPRLDGGAFARIGDTDRGRLDGDTDFDRAVGPMQFIPSTWASSGRDGNGDGVADPHNIYDASYAAAGYLCRGARGAPVDSAEGFAATAWSYNRSRPYGATTWQRAVAYSAVSPRVVGGLSDLP
jgi:membrane-bound lytic murein transglycosylase B